MDAARLAGPTDTERFSLLFEDAIGKILGAPHQNSPGLHEAGHRLVIFIDDLDRCEGSVSLRLLEAIKLYLATRYCVFVFGLDVTAVESAIAGAWAGRHRGLAREYLDKLFQAYVHMPMSTRYPILVHNRLADWRMIASEPLNPQSPLEKAHEAAHAIAAMLPSNPRKVKNFLNALRVAWEIAGLRGKSPPPNLKRFALVQRLRALAPATFRLIAQNPLEYIPELSDFFNACLVKSPISRGQNAHRLSVLLSDFGHIAVLDRDWEKAAANPSLTFDELHVRLDSIASDRDFARAWCENVIRPDEFCRYGGIGADHAASVGP